MAVASGRIVNRDQEGATAEPGSDWALTIINVSMKTCYIE